ncbi:hypothetical protein LTR91_004212 [Friedmanniomyces endolithicus]|uniref:Uncharacterized protein n=1 Tax=Friedmanniomyces endolithicus TaxID=329885 RepID=A0AAN6QZ12_9PEZI|nr:hypothetical protein LTR57_005319 [Friedmanniomyces endolithicus]KAK1004717.1 hypothetical protein LTR91_004212 [Friedmanniomyces endolithicus]KAK1045875.1 hypothetical protein LTS16_006301 [Friedmanniomyces endolithicus]
MEWYYAHRNGYTDFYGLDSWVEISSQPSSSSLSSINDEVVTTGLRVQHDPRTKRRRALRPAAPSHLNITQRTSAPGGTSSPEVYEESESESDRVMTSSGEGGLLLPGHAISHNDLSPAVQSTASEDSGPLIADDNDDKRTAINYPTNNDACFTPQPNAFSHPPSSGQARHGSAPIPGSYFPATRAPTRPTARHSLSAQPDRQNHMPQNILSPSYNAAAHHDEALRASLSTLLSCAAAARGLPKPPSAKRPQINSTSAPTVVRPNRIEPISFRLIPESAIPVHSPPHEPTFHPTLRRHHLRRPSTSTTSASASSDRLNNTNNNNKDTKRKAPPPSHPAAAALRSSSRDRERRALKKARRSSSSEDLSGMVITPTLLTWVVSAGVVVVLSALSFGAGYSLGKEAGRLEGGGGGMGGVGGGGFGGGDGGGFGGADGQVRGRAREAARSGLGLRRSLAVGSAVQV